MFFYMVFVFTLSFTFSYWALFKKALGLIRPLRAFLGNPFGNPGILASLGVQLETQGDMLGHV